MKLHAAYWVTAGMLAVAGIVMMGCAFVSRGVRPEGETWSDSFESFEELELKADYCTLRVEPIGADEECRIDFVNMPEDTKVKLENGQLLIDGTREEKRYRFVSFGDFNIEKGEITIYLPEKEYKKVKLFMGVSDTSVIDGMHCETLVIDAGVGNLELTNGTVTDELDLDCGTGDCTLRNLTIKGKSDVDFGVGNFRLDGVQMTKKCDLDIGTGDCDIIGSEFADLELDGGMGDLKMQSTKLLGNADLTLGTGDMELEVLGDPMDYDFRVDAGVGEVTIDGDNIKVMNNYDSKYEFKADSGVGDIEIRFVD
ncbi:MAG: DUF4097 family beta strand repeat protein [Oscillospiraceae bacterium]|nr:DUF4097 family beta strand repeat protein [Oscillospiraceae bacterium]